MEARGDSKPCTRTECDGRMHFRRDDADAPLRWVCDKDSSH